MNILRNMWYWFGPYVNGDERRVARLFSRVREQDSTHAVKDAIIALVQANAAAVNLWGERQYKGYAYLTKATRRKLYHNLALIEAAFEQYYGKLALTEETARAELTRSNPRAVLARSQPEKLAFLMSIMHFLRPARGLYRYHQSSSFGRLLRDPNREVLEGDCNQIVTLYLYLYATRYDVRDLQLLTYPGHVALQFQDLSIETTTGTFTHYQRDDVRVLPVQEIVSINLLDTSDEYFRRHNVAAATYLPAARLAYILSSERAVVIKNLQVAYHNAVGELLRAHRYAEALRYAEQSRSEKLVEMAGYNGAIHAMQSGQFDAARRFAAHTKEAASLTQTIAHNEAIYYYKKGDFHAAVRAFGRAGERDMVRRCYEALYLKAQKTLGASLTSDQLKNHTATLHRMRDYAHKSGNPRLIAHVGKLLRLG